MKHFYKKNYLLLLSCQQDDMSPQMEDQNALNPTENVNMIKLGKKLDNPYSVENMRRALANLKESSASKGKSSVNEIDITTTHLYVKFKPKTEEELSILKRDSTLILHPYPLDYEIEENGDF